MTSTTAGKYKVSNHNFILYMGHCYHQLRCVQLAAYYVFLCCIRVATDVCGYNLCKIVVTYYRIHYVEKPSLVVAARGLTCWQSLQQGFLSKVCLTTRILMRGFVCVNISFRSVAYQGRQARLLWLASVLQAGPRRRPRGHGQLSLGDTHKCLNCDCLVYGYAIHFKIGGSF